MYLEKLKALIPPPDHPECAGNPELYRQTDDRLGIKLPQDYYDFIAAYGTGMFGNWLVVYNPFTKNPHLNLFRQLEEWGIVTETLNHITMRTANMVRAILLNSIRKKTVLCSGAGSTEEDFLSTGFQRAINGQLLSMMTPIIIRNLT